MDSNKLEKVDKINKEEKNKTSISNIIGNLFVTVGLLAIIIGLALFSFKLFGTLGGTIASGVVLTIIGSLIIEG